jgi:hypothetical protein
LNLSHESLEDVQCIFLVFHGSNLLPSLSLSEPLSPSIMAFVVATDFDFAGSGIPRIFLRTATISHLKIDIAEELHL